MLSVEVLIEVAFLLNERWSDALQILLPLKWRDSWRDRRKLIFKVVNDPLDISRRLRLLKKIVENQPATQNKGSQGNRDCEIDPEVFRHYGIRLPARFRMLLGPIEHPIHAEDALSNPVSERVLCLGVLVATYSNGCSRKK